MTTFNRIKPCFSVENFGSGDAQLTILRYIQALPAWVRDNTVLYSQSMLTPLLEKARKEGFECGVITHILPMDGSAYILNHAHPDEVIADKSTLLLHTGSQLAFEAITAHFENQTGLHVASVCNSVFQKYAKWIEKNGYENLGILPPPITDYTFAKGRYGAESKTRIVWSGTACESKGIFSLPYILKENPTFEIKAFIGEEAGCYAPSRKEQTETLAKLEKLCNTFGVTDRLTILTDTQSLFEYKTVLENTNVLLATSKTETFLCAAAEALSCGIPVVVTENCGITEHFCPEKSGAIIQWNDDPETLAKNATNGLKKARGMSPLHCLTSATGLAINLGYKKQYKKLLQKLTRTETEHDNAKVTIGLYIAQKEDAELANDALHSILTQTQKVYNVILLIDGTKAWATRLANYYEIPFLCTDALPSQEGETWLHTQANSHCKTSYYKPLHYHFRLTPKYLEKGIASMQNALAFKCEGKWEPQGTLFRKEAFSKTLQAHEIAIYKETLILNVLELPPTAKILGNASLFQKLLRHGAAAASITLLFGVGTTTVRAQTPSITSTSRPKLIQFLVHYSLQQENLAITESLQTQANAIITSGVEITAITDNINARADEAVTKIKNIATLKTNLTQAIANKALVVADIAAKQAIVDTTNTTITTQQTIITNSEPETLPGAVTTAPGDILVTGSKKARLDYRQGQLNVNQTALTNLQSQDPAASAEEIATAQAAVATSQTQVASESAALDVVLNTIAAAQTALATAQAALPAATTALTAAQASLPTADTAITNAESSLSVAINNTANLILQIEGSRNDIVAYLKPTYVSVSPDDATAFNALS
jgi:hypothetical protein